MTVNLTDELHAAAGDPPPPGYDLDTLIRRGRARPRRISVSRS